MPTKPPPKLTAEQRRMYRNERMMNFRFVYKLLAKTSPCVLSSKDLVSAETHSEISAIGQWAQLAYSSCPPEFALSNLDVLSQTDFPLEGYDALVSSTLVSSFKGKVADVKGFLAYRPSSKQLVVSVKGTQTFMQAVYDLRFLKHRHRDGSQVSFRVHTGFWRMYKGIRELVMDGLKKGFHENEVDELVITGHSMGGAMTSLLAIDLLKPNSILRPGLPVKLVTFGSPRVGDEDWCTLYNQVLDDYRAEYGRNSVQEYSIKGFNDGVPLMPPYELGFHHCTKRPIYFYNARLFHIPESEREFGQFDVAMSDEDMEKMPPLHPKGGHNYYNGSDMEKMVRRMEWLQKTVKKGDDQWMDLYRKQVLKHEGAS